MPPTTAADAAPFRPRLSGGGAEPAAEVARPEAGDRVAAHAASVSAAGGAPAVSSIRGAAHAAAARRMRRSRPSPLPPPPSDAFDVPEDSAGRVEYVLFEDLPAGTEVAPDLPPAASPAAPVGEEAGWIAVAALVTVLTVVLVVGLRLTS